MSDGRHRLNVDQVRIGVAETLDEKGFCLGTDCLFEVGQVRRIHERSRNAIGYQRMLEQVVGTSVNILRRDDMVPRACDIKDGVRDGGCSGGDGQGPDASFQRSDPLLEDILGGIGQTAVDVARISKAETRCRVFGIVEYIGTRLINGNCARIGCRIGLFLSNVKLKGLEVKFSCAHCMFVFNCFPIAKLDSVENTNKKTALNSIIILNTAIFVENYHMDTL